MQPFDYNEFHASSDKTTEVGCSSAFQMNLFPTPVFKYQIQDILICDKVADLILKDILPNHAKEWKKYQNNAIKFRNNTITTFDDLHLDPKFEFLLKFLNPIVEMTIDALNISAPGFNYISMWANILGSGGYMCAHTHPNSFLSGVLYLKLPGENKGKLYLEDPRDVKEAWAFDALPDKQSMFQHGSWGIDPQVGTLVMFPSWLRHGTFQGKWKENEYRVALSFNVIPKFVCTKNTMKYTVH